MLGTTLQKIEEALGEIATAVSKHSTLLLITKTRTFPKITLNPDKNESIHYATDELIRCQRALNSARRHLTNLGIEPETPINNTPPKPNPYNLPPNVNLLTQPESVTGKPIPPTIGQPVFYEGTLTPGNASGEKTTQSTQGSQPTVRQPVRTDVPRVLGKPIGLPDNLSPHSES
jgi:hypothetical protein